MNKKMVDACEICGSKRLKFIFRATDYISGHNFTVLSCQNCGLGHSCPQPSSGNIKDFYPEEYYDERKLRFNFFARQFIRFSQWTRIKKILYYFPKKKGQMLDIGCGRGWQLKYFKEKGWEVYGTELSEISSSFARKELKLEIFIEDIKNCGFKDDFFDVVSFWHVLEHLFKPKEVLKQIWKITKNDGLIFITVPNFSSWQAKISKRFWFHLDIPRHLYHFTPESLEILLTQTNFKIIHRDFFSIEYGFFGIVQSLMNVLGIEFNFLWDLLTQKAGKIGKLRKSEVVINMLLLVIFGPICFLLGIIIEVLAVFFHLGAVLTIVAKKQNL